MIKQNIVTYEKFLEEYQDKLKTPSCLPRHVGELCGGWTSETFKQIIQKITKKNTAPLQLWFDSFQSMDIISTKRPSLKEVFRLLDTRNIQRIDSCELFSVMLFIAKGNYETILTSISQVFGFKNPQYLTKDEFFYFLDSFFRGISKILLLKNKNDLSESDVNKRLNSEDIKDITDKVYGNTLSFPNQEFAKYIHLNSFNYFQWIFKKNRVFQKSKYNSFFEYIYKCLQQSNDHERQISLQNIQIAQEVRKAINYIIQQVDININGEKEKK